MSNKNTLINHNNRLMDNNKDLKTILDTINNLPEAGSGSEDLEEELNAYDSKLLAQEEKLIQITELLDGKANPNEPVVTDYIQDGLYIHYDGIDNGGVGIHNTNTNTWVDLKGNMNSVIGTSVVINDDSIQTNGGASNTAAKIETGTFNISNVWTIEQRITIDKYTTTATYSNPGDCFLSVNQGNKIKWGNYLKNGMLYCNGYTIDTQVSEINPAHKAMTLSTTYDGTQFKNYINGNLVATVPYELTKDMTVTLMNGPYRYEHNHVTNVSVIRFHSCRYYNRVLSEDELKNNYIRDDQLYPIKFF